jgi:hypothetical protein
MSVTWAVNWNVLASFGVPESVPELLSDNPVGSVPPITDHL